MFSVRSMFSEEVYLDLLCFSVREPEPLEPYTWSRSHFFKRPEPFFKEVIRLRNTALKANIYENKNGTGTVISFMQILKDLWHQQNLRLDLFANLLGRLQSLYRNLCSKGKEDFEK